MKTFSFLKIGLIYSSLLTVPLSGQVNVGSPAPEFTLPDTAGNEISLTDFKDKIVLLNFFTTWCIPCQIEAPLLEDSIWQVYRDQGVVVIGSDFMEEKAPLVEFIRSRNLSYFFIRDSLGSLFSSYGFHGFPSNVIIGRDGKIVLLESGYDIPHTQATIDSLLNLTHLENESRQQILTPSALELISVYPNPFNGPVIINYKLTQNGRVWFRLFNTNGQRLIQKIVDKAKGTHSLRLELTYLSSGIYPFSMQSNGIQEWGKLVLQK